MKAIKRKILYPVLKLYSPNKILMAILSSKTIKVAYNITKKDTMNDISTLTFNASANNTIINKSSNEMLVKLENDFYIIKTIKINDDDKSILDITCESEFVETKGIKCQPLDLIGQSPEQLFNAIIASPKNVNIVGQYKWLGTDIVDTFRAVQTEDSVSIFENWLTMCEKFNAWMEFSTDFEGQKWVFLRSVPINNGKFLRKGQGLKSLDITFDTTGIFTRMTGIGGNDEITGNPINFIGVNPESKSYVEDISFYLAMGMTKEEIYAIPRCVQETDYTNSNITTPEELFRITKEELAKVCIPTVQGNISIKDYSVLEDTSVTEPMIGEQVIVIDQDISYSISTQIKTIERKYTESPFDVTTEISNIIKYDSVLKDLQHSSDTVNKLTSIATSNGNPVINTSNLQGSIDASLVKTGILKDLISHFWLNLTDGTFNFFDGKLYSNNGLINVPTQSLNTKDKQIANTEFVASSLKPVTDSIGELNIRQNVIIGTKTIAITSGTGNINLTITGLGTNSIIVTNGDYSLNQAQILGIKNISTDIITVYYSNAIDGNCKLNFTYSK
jgi:hypothetical protein